MYQKFRLIMITILSMAVLIFLFGACGSKDQRGNASVKTDEKEVVKTETTNKAESKPVEKKQEPARKKDPNSIVVGGTGANQELLRILATEFMKSNNAFKVEVPNSIGTGGGIKAVVKGIIDIARVARPLKEKEKKMGLTYKEFALSPVVFSANPDVKVKNLTGTNILKIYAGEITNWKELGGKDQKIYVIGREKGDSSREIIENTIPKFKDLTYRKDILIVAKDPIMIRKLKVKKGTIGFGTLSNMKKAELHVFTLDGMNPESDKYSLLGPFAFVYKGEPDGVSKKFLDFVFSSQGQNIIKKNYCIAK